MARKQSPLRRAFSFPKSGSEPDYGQPPDGFSGMQFPRELGAFVITTPTDGGCAHPLITNAAITDVTVFTKLIGL
jgi:hypothetical protein